MVHIYHGYIIEKYRSLIHHNVNLLYLSSGITFTESDNFPHLMYIMCTCVMRADASIKNLSRPLSVRHVARNKCP